MIYPGQLLITGINGLTLSDEEKTFIENEKIWKRQTLVA